MLTALNMTNVNAAQKHIKMQSINKIHEIWTKLKG